MTKGKIEKDVNCVPAIQRWFLRSDVRTYLHCSDDYIDDLIALGRITPHPASRNRGNKKVWYDRLEIDRYVESLRMA